MHNENLYHDPVEEVYRVRETIMEEFDWDVKKYNAYLDTRRPHWESMGFKFLTEEESLARRNGVCAI